jgi:hypothetical protein
MSENLVSDLSLQCYNFHFILYFPQLWIWSNWLRAGRPRSRSLSPGGGKKFLFSASSRLAMGSTLPPIQWVPAAFSLGCKTAGAWSWPYLQLVPRSRKFGSIHPPPPHTPSWRSALLVKRRDSFTFLPYGFGAISTKCDLDFNTDAVLFLSGAVLRLFSHIFTLPYS